MLSPLTLPKRISRWVNLKSTLSSISFSSSIQINLDIDQPISDTTDFDAKLQFLTNKLYPDTLVKILQSTSDVNSAVKIFKWAALQKRFYHTADTYYWIILKLGMAGNVAEMEGFCQNLVKDGCSGVEHALISLIESFIRHCRLNEAIRVLVNMISGGHRPHIGLFNIILEALLEERRGFQDVVFVYKEMVKAGVAPNIDTLNYLLEVLFETGKFDSALDQYRRIDKKGCSPSSKTFEIVIKGLVMNNQVNDSIIILHEMLKLECQPELRFYTCIIPLLCRENKMPEALWLFTMMRTSNSVPNSIIYSSLIECLCKNLCLDEAVNLLEEMMGSCFTPDSNVLVDIVNLFCKLGKINEALKFLEEKNFLETSPYNALLSGCRNAGKFFMAKSILEKMSERSMADCDSWNVLIRWFCEKAETRKACELLGRMIISSLVPNCTTYAALVLGHSRLSKCEDALRLFLQLHAKCWVVDSISCSELIEALCRAQKYQDATAVFHYMFANRCSLQSLPFSMLIKGICKKGMVNEAIRLEQMAYGSGASCANATYNSIMLGLSKSYKGRNLFVYLAQMLVKGCNLDAEAYCIVIRSLIEQNRVKDCALFFNALFNEGLIPDWDTLHSLLLHLANQSQLCLISNTINRLVTDTEVLDSAMYNILINVLWKDGRKNEACRLLDLMLEKGWVPDAPTHRLLIGSVDREESYEKMLTCKNLAIQDGVVDILAEGLGEV